MNKLQASLRDRAARNSKWGRQCYRIGSFFKGCAKCGEWHWHELANGRKVKRYTSGYDVFRAYCPNDVGWTYYCWNCGAKDSTAWENAQDLGMDAIRGSRDAIANGRAQRRRDNVQNPHDAKDQALEAEIKRLKVELLKLMVKERREKK